jgi:putative lipoprotein
MEPWRKVRMVRLASAAVVAACASPGERAEDISRLTPATYVFTCAGDYRFSARVTADSVHLGRSEGDVSLPQVEAASGARYTAGGVTFWSKGMAAALETPAGSHRDCTGVLAETPWAVARLLGNDFRAVGQEPGWMVEIDEGRGMHVIADYGEVDFQTPAPSTRRSDDGTIVHTARTSDHAVTITITDVECQDVMSGEEFPVSVTLELDGREYRGCGRTLDGTGESMLTAFLWTLSEIGGEPAGVEGIRAPELQFDDGEMRVSGFTGCNRLAGAFELRGDRLSLSEPLMTTRMACADPRGGELERRFVELLARVDRFSTAGGMLTLYDGEEPLARFSRP